MPDLICHGAIGIVRCRAVCSVSTPLNIENNFADKQTTSLAYYLRINAINTCNGRSNKQPLIHQIFFHWRSGSICSLIIIIISEYISEGVQSIDIYLYLWYNPYSVRVNNELSFHNWYNCSLCIAIINRLITSRKFRSHAVCIVRDTKNVDVFHNNPRSLILTRGCSSHQKLR